MNQFFKQRRGRNQVRMMKYLRYVFNDHFMLVCMIMLGGLGLYYSQMLKQLDDSFTLGPVIACVVLLLILPFGRVSTLLEPADEVFLLPKEVQMRDYFQRAFWQSMVLPSVCEVLVVCCVMPLLVVTAHQPFQNALWLSLGLIGLKGGELALQLYGSFQEYGEKARWRKMIWWLLAIISVTGGVYVTPFITTGVGVLTFLFCYQSFFGSYTGKRLDWTHLIAFEQQRMRRLLQFINLFTDVPEITSAAKRRKYFDVLLKRIPFAHKNTYMYLYARSFLRGQEFLGLYVRLVIVAGVMLFFLPEFLMALGVALLFFYVIGFQLIPLYRQFDYMLLTKLYPVKKEAKAAACVKLISMLLIGVVVVFSVMTLIALKGQKEAFFVITALLAELFLFVKIYLPVRMKKMQF